MGPLLSTALITTAAALVVLWTAGVVYYDMVGASRKGSAAAIAWVSLWVVAFLAWHPPVRPFLCLLASLAAILAWWRTLRPSQDRNWAPHFTRVAKVHLHGDELTIDNVRNSDYQGLGQSTPCYETREFRLSELCGLDALLLTWGSRLMSHPMFIFDFGPDGRLCISIEVRYREGQRFSFVRSLYRQQELIYVVSDERDAILRRTKFLAGHDLYLYAVRADNLSILRFFLDYAGSINALADEPRWYHGLTTNCTTSVYAQGRGHLRWSWRLILNGSLDKLLYARGLIDRSLPLERLKELSRVNDVANRAPVEGFGDYLRSNLPGYPRAEHPEPAAAEAEPA